MLLSPENRIRQWRNQSGATNLHVNYLQLMHWLLRETDFLRQVLLSKTFDGGLLKG